jgi:hypothetical protein
MSTGWPYDHYTKTKLVIAVVFGEQRGPVRPACCRIALALLRGGLQAFGSGESGVEPLKFIELTLLGEVKVHSENFW